MSGPDLLLGAPGTRVLLVGTSSHAPGSRLPAVGAVAASVADLGQALVERAGLDPAGLTTLVDPAGPQEFGTALVDAAREATGVLVLYFAGHGLVSAGNELHLATVATDDLTRGIPAHQALPYATVRDVLAGSRARLVVVVLDCCFSGRARAVPRGGVDDAFATVPRGMYLLSATGGDEAAWAPDGERHTAFTGALIGLLTEGDPTGPPRFTLDDLYRSLSRRLAERGLPRPRRQASDAGGPEVVAPNPAYTPPSASPAEPEGDFSPYRGLAAFGEEDARYYFGRDELTATLTGRVAAQRHVPGPLVVAGPSGAGKSSLLRAGLLPWLHGQDIDCGVLLPGGDPVRRLAATFGGDTDELTEDPASFRALLARPPQRSRPVIVIDQFEEVFIACRDETRRRAFVAALHAACAEPVSEAPAVVVIGVRADFFGHCTGHPELLDALARPVVVGPMTGENLRAVIEGPAALGGLTLQDGLADLLMDELGAGPGNGTVSTLPLLSHALLTTWQHREGRTLTLAGYRATGGIRRSLANTADTTLEALDPAGRRIARSLFPRLVRLGEGMEDTRRRVPRADLLPAPDDPDHHEAREVLDRFVRARLITVDEHEVEIAHEALIRAWPRLRGWIDEDRAGLTVRQQLAEDADAWARHGQDPSYLYRDTRLAVAQGAALGGPVAPVARRFLDAGTERDRQERAAVRRRSRVRTITTAVLAVLLLASLAGGGVAFTQWRAADEQRHAADEQRRGATALALLARADAIRRTHPATALRLEIAAHRIRPGRETLAALRASVAGSRALGTIDTFPGGAGSRIRAPGGPEFPVVSAALAPDGHLAAVALESSTILWDVRDPGRPRQAGTLPSGGTLAFGPAGLLAVGTATEVTLWDVADPGRPRRTGRLAHAGRAPALAFRADGRLLAVADTPMAVALVAVGPAGKLRSAGRLVATNGIILNPVSLAFRPDGRILAVGVAQLRTAVGLSGGETASLWEVGDPARPRRVARLDAVTGAYETGTRSMAFSADGRLLALSGSLPLLWDVSDPARPRRVPEPPGVGTRGNVFVAFSPAGPVLVTRHSLNAFVLWDLRRPGAPVRSAPLTGHEDVVLGARFDRSGGLLLTFGARSVRLWSAAAPPRPVLLDKAGESYPRSVSFSPDGAALLDGGDFNLWSVDHRGGLRRTPMVTGDPDNPDDYSSVAFSPSTPGVAAGADGGRSRSGARIWDLRRPGRPHAVPLPGGHDVASLAYAPGGAVLAGVDVDALTLWDTTDPLRPKVVRRLPLAGHSGGETLAFSPDGRFLAVSRSTSGSDRDRVSVWDTRDFSRPVVTLDSEAYVETLAFSPSGRLLVSGGGDTFVVWDVTDIAAPRRTASVTGNNRIVTAAFGRDDHLLATGGEHDPVKLWDVTDPARPRLAATLGDHDGFVEAVAFSPDGRRLVSGGTGPELELWDLTDFIARTARPLETACAMSGRGLTEAEWADHVRTAPYQATC
ncbi:caspase, EACC1-associated type [Sphaerisporangium aureirubrum]|uniref:Caspase family protein n=1 Tax=Sphaerisporangium aureirubrum TaxID=1544736 RepID=A0ABW1NH12_9ACTN